MGLASIIQGAGFVLAAITEQPWVWVAVAAAFSATSAEWYHRRFGFARPRSERLVWEYAGTAIFLVVLVAAWVLDRWLAPPVVLSLLVVAAGLCVGQLLLLRRVGLTPAHWAVYAAVAMASLVPMVGVANEGLATPLVLAVTGLALITLGLVDHRRLVRAMAGDDEALQR